MENDAKKPMTKKTFKAFGKKVYLLGRDEGNTKYYMEAPKWDCGHYWGVGYIECYTNNTNPSEAKDISSHQHFKGFVIGQKTATSTYTHHLNEVLKQTVLTESESWVLSELMCSIEVLTKTANMYKSGSANMTDTKREILQNRKEYLRLVQKVLPVLFYEVDKLLSPEKDEIKADFNLELKNINKE